ncbi:hypothetical protein JCM10449v2_002152 [Rhodotorula kratochvilovae]
MDPSTLLCTFTTAGKDARALYEMERGRDPLWYRDLAFCIEAIPTAWFRRAKRDDSSAHVVYGRVLAAAPDKYAVRACITEPVYPDDVGERLKKTGGIRDGWEFSYISTCDAGDFFDDMDRDGEYRLYHMPEGSGTPVEPGYCTVTSLKLP